MSVESLPMPGNRFHTVTEIAERAGVDRGTIHYRALRLRIDPAMVAGRTYLYSSEDADRLTQPLGVKQ